MDAQSLRWWKSTTVGAMKTGWLALPWFLTYDTSLSFFSSLPFAGIPTVKSQKHETYTSILGHDDYNQFCVWQK